MATTASARATSSVVDAGTDYGRAVLERAIVRARAHGATVELSPPASTTELVARADAVVAIEWRPLPGTPTLALLGMAARKPVIVLEVEATAAWPAFDPQTWQPRGYLDDTPIVISIDPRDEEHSLMLALVRLARDRALRQSLANAGYEWWRTHATREHALRAWHTLIAEGPAGDEHAPPPRDGSERARALLERFDLPAGLLPGIA